MIPAWLAFLLALVIIMVLAQKDLGVGLFAGAIVFGVLASVNLWEALLGVLASPNYLFLALSVTVIPLVGGLMERSGMMTELVDRLGLSKRAGLMLSPALFGLLPMPGGALLSAPLVDQVDPEGDVNRKVATNVWYRHVLILVYPIQASLIVATALAGINLYVAVAALLVPFAIMMVVGYAFLVQPAGRTPGERSRDWRRALRNLSPILLAPAVDLVARTFLAPLAPDFVLFAVPEILLFGALLLSLALVLKLSATPARELKPLAKEMHVWRYPLLIYGMFFFLGVFERSGVPELIGSWALPLLAFLLVAFVLGYATGRVQLPATILIPIYLAQHAGLVAIPLLDFALVYFAIFLGYVATPVHPCVAYSLKYFDTSYKDALKALVRPTVACFAILLAFTALWSGLG